MNHIDNIRGIKRNPIHGVALHNYLKALKETQRKLERKRKGWPIDVIHAELNDVFRAIKEAEK